MNHQDHLIRIAEAVQEGRPIDACPECEEIVSRLTVAGDPIPVERLSIDD